MFIIKNKQTIMSEVQKSIRPKHHTSFAQGLHSWITHHSYDPMLVKPKLTQIREFWLSPAHFEPTSL